MFLTWIEHRRTREICTALSIPLVELVSRRRGLARYATLVPRTLALLRQRRPAVVIVQNPSLVLTLLCVLVRPVLRFRLVIDAHNEAVNPFKNKGAAIRWLTDFVNRKADLVIVTNRQLAATITRLGTKAIVLPDLIPQAPDLPAAGEKPHASFRVAVIATYAADEPIAAIFEAAALAGPEFEFGITGNPARLDQQLRSRSPANIRFTGFLEEADFWSLLKNSHVVMDLTQAENCLVCGAYESLAVGTPMILSDSPASQELFGPSACYADNSPGSIVAALRDARSRLEELRRAAPGVRDRMNREWVQQATALRAEMSRLQGPGATGHG